MIGSRNFTRATTDPWFSTTTGGTDRGLLGTRSLHLALGAMIFFLLAAAMQPCAVAQRRGEDPNVAPPVQGQNPNGMRIYIWGGLKSHGEGFHDYPQFLADWSKILTEHGAVVDGGFHAPTSAVLEHTDVVLIYKGDAGYLTADQRTMFDAYVKRGGNFVTFHDSGCGPDPAYFSSLIGGAKKHGVVNYSAGSIHYTVADKDNPIMKDMSDLTIDDEAFFLITWAKDPPPHTLVTTVIPQPRANPQGGNGPGSNRVDDRQAHIGEVVPQMWTWEHTVPGGQPSRSFVWMQGHTYTTFSIPAIQKTLLRGIAWAGKRPVDELVNYVPPANPRGGRGPRAQEEPQGRGGQ